VGYAPAIRVCFDEQEEHLHLRPTAFGRVVEALTGGLKPRALVIQIVCSGEWKYTTPSVISPERAGWLDKGYASTTHVVDALKGGWKPPLSVVESDCKYIKEKDYGTTDRYLCC